jgi:hypothetical protein
LTAVAAVFACACALVAPALASAADGSIAGKVTEAAAGHAAIEDARVCVLGLGVAEDSGCDFTDASGDYVIPGLTPDDYLVAFQAQAQGYLIQYYDHASSFEDADEVTVSSGVQTPNVNAELIEGGRIEGTVGDAVSKAGVDEVEVCAYLEEGPEEFEFGGCGLTDPSGDYEIGGLADGEYIVEFWAFREPDYVFEFYDDKPFFQQATKVSVAAAGPVAVASAELTKGGRIAGTVINAANGLPLEEIGVCAREGAAPNRYLRCTWTNAAGKYTLRGLASGAYKVEFSAQFEGEPDDGFPAQYWNGKATLAQAELVTVAAPGTTLGIDARLGTAPLPPVIPPTAPVIPAKTPVKPAAPKKCKKGFQKKKAKGKSRCVKKKKYGKGAKGRVARALFQPSLPSRFLLRLR